MKSSRYNKVLGLAMGERSILAAEVSSASGAQPEAKKLAEFVFPEGVAIADPAALGKALGGFLRDNHFSEKRVVIGIPAKWLVVKSKELPPADPALAADMLRLGAEGEFSSELRDLVYDYAGQPSAAKSQTVLLMATPRKYVDLASQMCEAAKLNLVAVTASVAALSSATGRTVGKNAVVLSLAAGGAELSAQTAGQTTVLRHLRAPMPEAIFLSDLRRAVLQIPTNGSAREMVIWNPSDQQSSEFGTGMGMPVRTGDLAALGVGTDAAASNGGGRKYAPAVALALSCLGDRSLSVDFLHSKLAAPKKARVPAWAIWSTLAAAVLIAAGVLAYRDLQSKEAKLARLNAQYDSELPLVKTAEAFNTQVALAQGWHGGDPRYLNCLLALTRAFPEDGLIFATGLSLKETPKAPGKNAPEVHTLTGQIHGKAPDQPRAQVIFNQLKNTSGFSAVNLKSITGANATGPGPKELTFTLDFVYTPPKAAK